MNEYTFIPMRDFKRSEADASVFYIIDLNDGLIVNCDQNTTYDMFFELLETPGVYVAYKEKSPCCSTD